MSDQSDLPEMSQDLSLSEFVTFETNNIRRKWYDEQWYFSVVDVVAVLTGTEYQTARKYWNKLSERMKHEEDFQLETICHRLKLRAADGKSYLTDCANTEGLFRIIQSIPSKKAEPFKRWLAKVGHERLQEMTDPVLAVDRGRNYWKKHGYPEAWIQRRMMGQEVRNKLTDRWTASDIKEGKEFAILTNIIHEEWSGLTVGKHKQLKNLTNQNLRDHMSEEELIFTALAELSTRKIAETENAIGMKENKIAAKKVGSVAKKARMDLENKTGQKVVSNTNYFNQKHITEADAKSDPEAQELMRIREKAIRDYTSDIASAKDEGKVESKRETAVKLLSMGLSVEHISQATGFRSRRYAVSAVSLNSRIFTS